ncbi:MAG: hypothetical protein M1834_008793 [Cirrosporium novae-zelandiae]|nr:MAG: hypothetical protein M1834_008793 [Cirrosporium novae-zelandiae]
MPTATDSQRKNLAENVPAGASPTIHNFDKVRVGKGGSFRGDRTKTVTPSEYLIAALEDIQSQAAVPYREVKLNKRDLSRFDPSQLPLNLTTDISSTTTITKSVYFPSRQLALPCRRSSLTILADHIRFVQPFLSKKKLKRASPDLDLNGALQNAYGEENKEYLRRLGLDILDVMPWASMILSDTAEEAAQRLVSISCRAPACQRTRVPTSIFGFLLRRKDINVHALKILTEYASSFLEPVCESKMLPASETYSYTRDRLFPASPLHPSTIDPTTIAVIVIRLMRHARRIWPEALPWIASMFCRAVSQNLLWQASGEHHKLSTPTLKNLNFMFCRMIRLLSLPSSEHPFAHATYRQQAQFHILRTMDHISKELGILLVVSREAYRAIASVQLADKKSPEERQRAEMKAKSWPPWREDKLGIDSERISQEMGLSRATKTLAQMMNSGYTHTAWEKEANIFAGWDTDRSPTIQTRTIMRRFSVKDKPSSGAVLDNTHSWVARIKATRTIQEAWACFLAYKDSSLPPSLNVYFSIFEKLALERKRQRVEFIGSNIVTHRTNVLPGDRKELFVQSSDPQEAVYPRSPPPSVDNFFNQMMEIGLRPTEEILGGFFRYTETLNEGFRYLESSTLPREVIDVLSCTDVSVTSNVKNIPEKIFCQWIRVLCTSAPTAFSWVQWARRRSPINNPLFHAIHLTRLRQSTGGKDWNHILHALKQPGRVICPHLHQQNTTFQDIASWTITVKVVNCMIAAGVHLNFELFSNVCECFLKRVQGLKHAYKEDPQHESKWYKQLSSWGADATPSMEDILVIFNRLVGSRFGQGEPVITDSAQSNAHNSSTELPWLLAIPHPAHLHVFIQVLQSANDYETLVDLIKWMCIHDKELEKERKQYANGDRLMRRTLTCIRIFLEQCDDQGTPIHKEVMLKIQELIKNQKSWGGWPTYHEVEEYMKKRQST